MTLQKEELSGEINNKITENILKKILTADPEMYYTIQARFRVFLLVCNKETQKS